MDAAAGGGGCRSRRGRSGAHTVIKIASEMDVLPMRNNETDQGYVTRVGNILGRLEGRVFDLEPVQGVEFSVKITRAEYLRQGGRRSPGTLCK